MGANKGLTEKVDLLFMFYVFEWLLAPVVIYCNVARRPGEPSHAERYPVQY